MHFIGPMLIVEDIKRSRDFYEKLLGQKIKFDFGQNITFHGGFSIHLKIHFEGLIERDVKFGGNAFELYFEEDELEEIAKKLRKESGSIIHDVKEQPWRQRVLRFYDPDGHIIEVGESMGHLCCRLEEEGVPLAEISHILQVPAASVKHLIERHHRAE